MSAPELWRVVVGDGHTHTPTVRRVGSAWVAMELIGGAQSKDRNPRCAVTRLAARLGWDVVEIRGPGEATTVEQVERVTAVACAEIANG